MSPGLSGIHSNLASMMQILLEGAIKQSSEMAKASVAAGVEMQVAAEKMAVAESIIDTYA